MPVTTDGMQRFLDFWLYGVLKTARQLGNLQVFLREVQEESIAKFIVSEHIDLGELPPSRSPAEAIRTYMALLEEKGVMVASDVTTQAEGDRTQVSFGETCPYRSTCNWIREEGTEVLCFRSVALAVVMRALLHRDYDWTVDAFAVPCRVTFTPSPVEAEPDGT